MDAFTGADSVGIYLSGGPENTDPAASLGGEMSVRLVQGVSPIFTAPVQGLIVEDASPENEEGSATITILNDTAAYTPPDGLPGPTVTIAEGERKVLHGADTSKYVRIYREADKAFAGLVKFDLVDTMNGVISMDNVPDAERVAGSIVYRAVFLEGFQAVEDIQSWLTTSHGAAVYSLATETPDSNGTIQTISDEYTEPVGLSWQVAASEATAKAIGDLAEDETIGLWFRRIFLGSLVAITELQVDFHLRYKGE